MLVTEKSLRKQNAALEIKLRNIRNRKRHYQKIRELTGAGYGWYENIPNEYRNTIYAKHRYVVEQYAKGNLSKEFLFQMKYMCHRLNRDKVTLQFFLACDGVIPCGNEVRLILEDPYNKIVTEPIPVKTDRICQMIGKMLIVKLCMYESKPEIEVKKIMTTNLPFREEQKHEKT